MTRFANTKSRLVLAVMSVFVASPAFAQEQQKLPKSFMAKVVGVTDGAIG